MVNTKEDGIITRLRNVSILLEKEKYYLASFQINKVITHLKDEVELKKIMARNKIEAKRKK